MTSHTEEEEMEQRRQLLALARKGDKKAIDQLMELYQVRVYSGKSLSVLKARKAQAASRKPKRKRSVPLSKRQPKWQKPLASKKTQKPLSRKKKSKVPLKLKSRSRTR